MKASPLKAEITVSKDIKAFALILAILETVWGVNRERLIKQVASYYGVTL